MKANHYLSGTQINHDLDTLFRDKAIDAVQRRSLCYSYMYKVEGVQCLDLSCFSIFVQNAISLDPQNVDVEGKVILNVRYSSIGCWSIMAIAP